MHPDLDIQSLKGITQDSRQVQPGYLFAALQGETTDGRDYIPDALAQGASVILSDESVEPSNGAIFIIEPEPRKAFAHIVSEFYSKQPDHIIAVTGTNGKSSVVHFIHQLYRTLGENAAYIGTLSGALTTPDPVSLHETLAKMAEEGITHVAMEASSHGLEQYRVDGVNIDIAAFTSFSQDHLDYHENMGEYLSAKSRLFTEVLKQDGIAVLNADIPEYETLATLCRERGVSVCSYGEKGEDIRLLSREITGGGQRITISISEHDYTVNLPLVGAFQVMNVLCALACVMAQYPEKTNHLINALETLDGVPGRLQHVSDPDGMFNAYVDYAHTPDALENVLKALRPHTKGRLICVFGCGGDRDKAKRPMMGAIAAELSDIAIVTDDNPRSENPVDIRKDILAGMGEQAKIHDINGRREAIAFGVSQLGQDDILLIAGKGHEQGQIFDGFTESFDDVYEVNNLFLKYKEKTA